MCIETKSDVVTNCDYLIKRTAEQNYLLLQEIEANRRFLLMVYQQNPKLLKNAEARIKQMFEVAASSEPNGHGKSPDDVACHVRFPDGTTSHSTRLSKNDNQVAGYLPSSLDETTNYSTKLPKTAAKSLVIPQASEGGKDSLREFHINEVNPAGMKKQRGVSLIELIMFIVIISVAVTGVLLVMNQVTGHSADTLIRKQALAIAESLLEEVELMPFTYCDPNDASAVSATSTAGCTGGAAASQDLDGVAPLTVPNTPIPNGELRGNSANPFDNVADYGGYGMSPIVDITGNTVGLSGYSANVALTRVGTTFIGGAAVAGDALLVTVTVTAPDSSQVVLDGYRTRYAPNDLP